MPFEPITLEAEDLAERMKGRVLGQFKDSTVFMALIDALSSEIQAFLDAAINTIKGRCPYEAETYALDVIGRLVGQTRTLIDYGAYNWFEFDNRLTTFDGTPWWVHTAPVSGRYQAENEDFRKLIGGKVIKNHVKYGSIPEIQDFISATFEIPCDIEWVSAMQVDIWVPWYTDDNTMATIASYSINGEDSDRNYFIPLPAGYQISNIYREPVFFGGSSVLFGGSSVFW